MMKKFSILVVVVALAGYYFWSHADSFLKSAIETYGGAATKTDVRLDRASVSLTSGSGTISGLSVGNPPGFQSVKALSLGDVTVKVDTSSVAAAGPIVIEDVMIDKPDINYEMTASGDSNLQVIARNARGTNGDGMRLVPAPGGKTVPPATESRKIVIRNLVVKNGHLKVSSPLLGGRPLSATMPEVHITNLGGSKGLTPVEVARVLLNTLATSAGSAATMDLSRQLGSVKDLSKGAAKGLKDGVSSQLKNLLVH